MKTKPEGNSTAHRTPQLGVLLILIVAASFAVRLAALAYWKTGAIESEGAEYARIAENLRNGSGYVGLVTPGSEELFSPLFPLLIAGASFVTRNYEWAGRLVTLILGALLPLPVFGIASRLFNRRVGFIAAILTLLHPLLVNLSFTVFSEGPYATLLLSAVYVVIRALNSSSMRLWFLAGGAFGLSWLIRAEATAVFAVAVLFALTATRGDRSAGCKRALAAIAVFLVLALPEVIFIYRSTGKIRLEGKSTLFFYTGKRILAAERHPGVDYVSSGGQHEVPSSSQNIESSQRWEEKWAFYGIDSRFQAMGVDMRPHAEVIRETKITVKELVRLVAAGLRQNAPVLFQRLSSDWFGAPLLPALALLGAFRRPWRVPQALSRLFVLLVAAAPVVATFFALWNDARYSFVLIPLLSIWAANGLFEVGLWLNASSTAAGWTMLARPLVCFCIIPGLIGAAMVISPIKGVRRLYLFADSALPARADKDVGEWIGRQQNHPVRIMDISLPLAYHAGAKFSYFPYAAGDLALRYIDAAQVDYIVMRRGEKFTIYYEDWLKRGIPDPRAELLQLPPLSGADKFLVFRWHRLEAKK